MDFTSIVLIQIAIVYCLAILLPNSRSKTSLRIVAVGVLVLLSMSWYYRPEISSKVGMVTWLLLLVVPMSLLRQLEALVEQSQYLAASRLAQWLRWLVPTDGMWHYHHLLQGIDLAQQGDFDRAQAIFDRYPAKENTESGRAATALLYRSTDRWHEYMNWVQSKLTLDRLSVSRPQLLVDYLRAFAETGDLRRCIAEVSKLDRTGQINTNYLNLLKVYVLAYCGRVEAVNAAFQTVLTGQPEEAREFWIDTAALAAGNPIAKTQLTNLRRTTNNTCLQRDIDWRLSQPLPDLQELNSFDWETVTQIEAELIADARYLAQAPTDARAPVTNFLIWANVLVFAAELLWRYRTGERNLNFLTGDRSPTSVYIFINWGGLVAPLVLSGQWWRLLTANFLHFNSIHLGMNMLGLYYLGKFVEYRLGSLRYLLAYLVAGIGSMAVITYVDTQWLRTLHVTVGASGAIMGMLGAMGAIHLLGWRTAKAAAAGRQFQAVLFSVGFQLIFDITNGHTSIVGHFSGLTIGFLVTLLLTLFGTRE